MAWTRYHSFTMVRRPLTKERIVSEKVEYKGTLNLPQTDFPMKADLSRREPELLARWRSEGLYESILAARARAPR